jgi:hypothetical protein
VDGPEEELAEGLCSEEGVRGQLVLLHIDVPCRCACGLSVLLYRTSRPNATRPESPLNQVDGGTTT